MDSVHIQRILYDEERRAFHAAIASSRYDLKLPVRLLAGVYIRPGSAVSSKSCQRSCQWGFGHV